MEKQGFNLSKVNRKVEGLEEDDLDLGGQSASMSLEKRDRSLFEFHRWYSLGRLIVDPDWQRQYIWDKKRASRLIESFLIDLPVPVIYLAINEYNKYEVIDGLQRLTSIFRFFQGEYALAGLEIMSEFNGLKFNDLPSEKQSKLEDATLRTFELSQTTPKDLMFIIFERLNTGGMALNDMEIRNCLYRGKLNDLIKELATNTEFRKVVNQKGLGKRMIDRVLVLRFLAFYQMTYTKARKGLKKFFNEFFETYRNPNNEKHREFKEKFSKSIRACYTVFGDKGFRLRKIGNKRGGGEWAPRVNATIFQIISVSLTEYDLGALTRKADSIYEAYVDLVCTDNRWIDCVTAATGDFARILYSFETWNNRLKQIMKTAIPNDTKRLFSRQLKEEMFMQSRTCYLCGQQIVLINDAALDHKKQYWLGGQTVPENARLVHRQCNLERERR